MWSAAHKNAIFGGKSNFAVELLFTLNFISFSPTAATVEFAQPHYSVSETGVSVTVTLNLTGILDRNTTVRYALYE